MGDINTVGLGRGGDTTGLHPLRARHVGATDGAAAPGLDMPSEPCGQSAAVDPGSGEQNVRQGTATDGTGMDGPPRDARTVCGRCASGIAAGEAPGGRAATSPDIFGRGERLGHIYQGEVRPGATRPEETRHHHRGGDGSHALAPSSIDGPYHSAGQALEDHTPPINAIGEEFRSHASGKGSANGHLWPRLPLPPPAFAPRPCIDTTPSAYATSTASSHEHRLDQGSWRIGDVAASGQRTFYPGPLPAPAAGYLDHPFAPGEGPHQGGRGGTMMVRGFDTPFIGRQQAACPYRPRSGGPVVPVAAGIQDRRRHLWCDGLHPESQPQRRHAVLSGWVDKPYRHHRQTPDLPVYRVAGQNLLSDRAITPDADRAQPWLSPPSAFHSCCRTVQSDECLPRPSGLLTPTHIQPESRRADIDGYGGFHPQQETSLARERQASRGAAIARPDDASLAQLAAVALKANREPRRESVLATASASLAEPDLSNPQTDGGHHPGVPTTLVSDPSSRQLAPLQLAGSPGGSPTLPPFHVAFPDASPATTWVATVAPTAEARRGRRGGVHSNWTAVQTGTAVCDFCDKRGHPVVQRCATCNIQCCRRCMQRKKYGESHCLDDILADWTHRPSRRRAKNTLAKKAPKKGSGGSPS